MEKAKAARLAELERISSFHSDKLVGGFSKSFAILAASAAPKGNNYNCNGANCTEGCNGGTQNTMCRS